MDLKKELGLKYDDLVKCDFIKDIDEILSEDGLINIDLYDIKAVCNGEIIGTISTVIADPKEELKITRISDKEPNSCLLNVTSSMNMSIFDVDTIIKSLKKINPDLSIIYGTTINEAYDGKYKVQALLSYSEGLK